jgi:AcrR family transcriptional regulator
MTAEATTSGRVDRRKERTRNALVGAARHLLSEGRTNVSIQEITDAADVGFGSFYNHFESKEALFRVAVESTVEDWALLRDQIVAGFDDPAEVFAVSFRMAGRLQRQAPELARALLNSGLGVLTHDQGLAPRARRDIVAATEAGRFDVEDPDIALMAAGGSLLGLLHWLDVHADADAAALSDEMAERILRMFGLTKREARKLCTRPLPPQPQL